MLRKLLLAFLLLVLLFGGLYIFRAPILRSVATFLIHEDELQKADLIVVLSGGGFDRGNEAVKVYRAGFAPKILCTGGNPVIEMKVFGLDTLESDMTVANLRRQLVPDSDIVQIREGTSTKEEAHIVIDYCQTHSVKKIIIVSSLLHTGRARKTFSKIFRPAGIEVVMHGTPSSRFDEMHWWKSEEGLITVNNEWIKQFYYWTH